MKFVLKPSLEYMTLVKIAISLWNQNDVKSLILMKELRFYWDFSPTSEKWKNIEEKVSENVPQLSLPQPLEEKVSGCIKPIGLQILEWMKFHHRYLRIRLPAQLCWSAQGTIDRKKTAEMLIKDENLDIATRYKLACIYCLEKEIHEFWKTMPEDFKKSHLDTALPGLVNFWSEIGENNAHFSNTYKLEYCAKLGNKVAAQYFLLKLTPREREESLIKTAKSTEDADVLFFLLSEMEEEQQIELFKEEPFKVLSCLLQWPWQSFFIANCMWDFLSKVNFNLILIGSIRNLFDDCKDWNYHKLFIQFWQEKPDAVKSFLTNEIDKSCLLPFLFHIQDRESIRMILKDATLTVRQKLMHSDQMYYFCQWSIRDNEWDFLEFCIRECFPSKNDRLKFKEAFDKRIKWHVVDDHLVTNKHKWDKLFCAMDDSTCKQDKRSSEEGENSSSKRFRSLQ